MAAGTDERALAVWIEYPGDPRPEAFDPMARRLEDVAVTLILERAPTIPDRVAAHSTLAVYRAAAVLWREADGTLFVLLRGAEGPESFNLASGTPEAEALWVRELLAARVLGENLAAELLVTAPEEVVPAGEPRQLVVTRPRARAPDRSTYTGSLDTGPRFAVGWRWRAHFDDVTWGQHGISFHLPAWRFSPALEARVAGAIGLPARIGEAGLTWLELTDLELGLGAAARPLRGRHLDAELFVGAGAYYVRAAAFLVNGTSRSADHLAGQLTAGVGIAWRPSGWVELRLHGGVHRVLGPSWFSINGNGDFGAAPWQPFFGLDLSVSLQPLQPAQ